MNQNQNQRFTLIMLILALAMLAFELFNYDTTRFALASLFGSAAFYGLSWATILAIAFCGIDLAGLVQMFSVPLVNNPKENQGYYFLFAAWLLGASLNAIMTWYAVGITLLGVPLGNEILTRQQLVRWVPLLIAMLVWITRILFIGALTIMGDEFARVLRRKRPVPPLPVTHVVPRPHRQRAILREAEPLQPSRAAQRLQREELIQPLPQRVQHRSRRAAVG